MKVFGALGETEDGEEKEAEQGSGGAVGFTEGNRGAAQMGGARGGGGGSRKWRRPQVWGLRALASWAGNWHVPFQGTVSTGALNSRRQNEKKIQRDKGGAHAARDPRRAPGSALAPRRKGPPARPETPPALCPGPRSASPRPSEPLAPPHLPTAGGWLFVAQKGEGPGGACGRPRGAARVSASRIPSARSWGSRPTSGEIWRQARRGRDRAPGPRRPRGGGADFPERSRSAAENARGPGATGEAVGLAEHPGPGSGAAGAGPGAAPRAPPLPVPAEPERPARGSSRVGGRRVCVSVCAGDTPLPASPCRAPALRRARGSPPPAQRSLRVPCPLCQGEKAAEPETKKLLPPPLPGPPPAPDTPRRPPSTPATSRADTRGEVGQGG